MDKTFVYFCGSTPLNGKKAVVTRISNVNDGYQSKIVLQTIEGMVVAGTAILDSTLKKELDYLGDGWFSYDGVELKEQLLNGYFPVGASSEHVNKLNHYEGGGTRSKKVDGLDYHLIPYHALRRYALRCSHGAKKHGPRNWESGMPAKEVYKHTMEHLLLYMAGDREDDHLGAAIWGIGALIHFEEEGRVDLFEEMPEDLQQFVQENNTKLTGN